MLKNGRNLPKHNHRLPNPSYKDTIAEIYDLDGKDASMPVTFQVTEDCNLRCTYCYQINKTHNRMSLETAKRAIDMLMGDNAYFEKEFLSITLDFIGGEPLLEIDLIRDIYEYFLNKCIELNHPWLKRHRISLCTNGVLYFDEKVQKFFKDYYRTVSLGVSIDGTKDQHDACRIFPDGSGSYEMAVNAARYHRAHYDRPGTKMTISPGNVHRVKDSIINLWNEGFEWIPANCVFEPGWTVEHARELYKQMKELADYCYENDTYSKYTTTLFKEQLFGPYMDGTRNWCGGTGNMIAVDYRGVFYPCLRYMPSSLGNQREPLVVGDIHCGLCTKQEEKDLVNELNSITADSQSSEECKQCPIRDGCAWCSAYNYQMTGSVNSRVTYICIMHKARALANYYYWNRFYEKRGLNAYWENFVPEEWAIEIIGEDEWKKLKDVCEKQRLKTEI